MECEGRTRFFVMDGNESIQQVVSKIQNMYGGHYNVHNITKSGVGALNLFDSNASIKDVTGNDCTLRLTIPYICAMEK